MVGGKRVKNSTQLIILSVLILTIITLSISYSAFFNIQSSSTIKEIATGVLNVNATASPMANDDLLPTKEVLPTTEKDVLLYPNENYASVQISNAGNIDANFLLSISYNIGALPEGKGEEDLISFDYLILGIYDNDNKVWLNLNPDKTGSPIYNMTISQFKPTEEKAYPVLKDVINKSEITDTVTEETVRDLRIYVWLADNTPPTEIGKLVYLKLDVRSTPIKGQTS